MNRIGILPKKFYTVLVEKQAWKSGIRGLIRFVVNLGYNLEKSKALYVHKRWHANENPFYR